MPMDRSSGLTHQRAAPRALIGAAVAAAAAVSLLVWTLPRFLATPAAADSPFAALLARGRASLWDAAVIVAAALVVVPAVRALGPSRIRAWVEPATAEALGALRMLVASVLLASALWEDLPSTAYLPREMLAHNPLWLVSWLLRLPGMDAFFASPSALGTFELGLIALLAMAAAGLFTRWTVPAAAVGYLLMAVTLRSYAWSYHTGLVPLYALLLLSLTPCGDAWSLDRLRHAWRGRALPPARRPELRYGVGRFLVWMAIALPYVFAGLSKVRDTGLLWWNGEQMKQMVVATTVEPMHFDFQLGILLLQGPDWVWGALGLAALAGELTFGLVLVSRTARRWLPLGMAGMHVGILLTQNILFPDLIALQVAFFDWRPLRDRLFRARGAPARPTADRHAAQERRPGPVLLRAPLAFLLVAAVAWGTRTERFPLTAMRMFSRPAAPLPVEYVQAWAIRDDGSRERARFERWIGAVADTRYRWLLRDWERRPERLTLLQGFLDAAGARANHGAPPGRRVASFELEQRRWDFRLDPRGPEHGEVIRVVRHVVEPLPR
jgi:hypothetical protein